MKSGVDGVLQKYGSRSKALIAEICAVVVVTLALVWFATFVSVSQEVRHTLDSQQQIAVASFTATEAAVRGLQASFQATTHIVDADEFRLGFEQIRRNYPYIVRASLAYRISASELSTFESETADRGMVEYKVFSRSSGYGSRSEAQTSGDLFPVVFSEPLEDLSAVEIGHDLLSSPTIAEVLAKSVENDSALVTMPYEVDPGRFLLAVVVPIYSGKGGVSPADNAKEKNIGAYVLYVDPSHLNLRPIGMSLKLFSSRNDVLGEPLVKQESLHADRYAFLSHAEKSMFNLLGGSFVLEVSRAIGPYDVFSHASTYFLLAFGLFSGIILYTLNQRRADLFKQNDLLTTKNRMLQERELALSEAIIREEDANDAKTRFLGVISHEIRTPLNAILGYLTFLRSQHIQNEEGAKVVQLIETNSSHLLEIFNRMVDYSRDQASGFLLTRQRVDLRLICAECVDAARTEIDSSAVTMSLNVDAQCAFGHVADSARIKQVLSSLLSNSAKFTRSGTIVCSVDVLEVSPTAQRLRFRVSDTGVGIDPKFLSYRFGPFSQEDDSLSRRYGGIGLGLSIIRGIVEVMQGNMVVNSEKGKGTVVDVTLWLEVVP